MKTIDKRMSRKIPCGDLPERYPRTNAKKYRESSIWEKMGPDAREKSETEKSVICTFDHENAKIDDVTINSHCFCGAIIKGRFREFPITCSECRTIHNVEVRK